MNLGKTEWWKVGKWQVIIQWKGWIGYTGLTGNIYLSGIAMSRMTLAKHTKVAINMNTRMPGFKHGMVTSDTERQDSSDCVKRGWVYCQNQWWKQEKCQVHSILQPYPHEPIHIEGHYTLLLKQADYKLWSPKKRTLVNLVVYVWRCVVFCSLCPTFVVFCSLLVNFVVYVDFCSPCPTFVVFCSLSVNFVVYVQLL